MQCVADKLHQRQHVPAAEHQHALALQDTLVRLPAAMVDPMLKQACASQLCKRLMTRVSVSCFYRVFIASGPTRV